MRTPGLAYLSVAWNYEDVPFLFFLFFLEKMFSFVHWLMARSSEQATQAAGKDALTKMFFAAYGIGTFSFGVFFREHSAGGMGTLICLAVPSCTVMYHTLHPQRPICDLSKGLRLHEGCMSYVYVTMPIPPPHPRLSWAPLGPVLAGSWLGLAPI